MTVQVRVDWGDGTVESVLAEGTADSWTLAGRQHTYFPGSWTVVVTGPDGSSDSTHVNVSNITSTPWLSGASGAGVADGSFGAWRGGVPGIAGTWINDPACYPLVPPDAGCPECGELANWTGPIDVGLSPPDFTTWAAEAGGAHDAFWTALAANLKTVRGPRTTWVRPYYEFNGDWMPWSVPVAQQGNFRTAFNRTANILRTGYPGIKIMLGAAAGGPGDVTACWPTATVDALSIDFYNTFPWVNTQQDFTNKITSGAGANSLEPLRQLAQTKGVPVAISEWASSSVDVDGSGGGDAPVFFSAMRAWLASHAGTGAGQVFAEVFFNIEEGYPNDYYLLSSTGVVNPRQPNAAAMYRSLW